MKWPMRSPIALPNLEADSVAISVWFANVGDEVFEGDRLVEVLVGGATFDVASPATGRLAVKLALPDDVVIGGQVLGFVDEG